MRKHTLIGGAVVLCLLFFAGCKAACPGEHFDVGNDLSKAQKIVVHDAAGNEKAVLAGEAEIDAFVEAVNVGGWRFEEVPEGLTEAGGFTLWQEETVTALLGEKDAKVNEICTFRIYQDGDYLTIETGLIDVPFAIPQSTAEYLRGLTA